jgi:hypothetical protein
LGGRAGVRLPVQGQPRVRGCRLGGQLQLDLDLGFDDILFVADVFVVDVILRPDIQRWHDGLRRLYGLRDRMRRAG